MKTDKDQFIEAKIKEFEEKFVYELVYLNKSEGSVEKFKSFLRQSLSEMSDETLGAVKVGKKEGGGFEGEDASVGYNQALTEVEQKKKEWNG